MTKTNPYKEAQTAHILAIDDNKIIRKSLEKMLLNQGHQIETAANGKQGLEMAERIQPELILLDIVMPDLNGWEVCTLLKQNPATKDIPVIMLTALDDVDALEQSFHAGAVDYIRKPFNHRELNLRINNTLLMTRNMNKVQEWNRRTANDLKIASSLQKSILSTVPIFTPYFDVFLQYYPSKAFVGGDVFDIISRPNGDCCIYLADVSGHGVGPALASSMVKVIVKGIVDTLGVESVAGICNQLELQYRNYITSPSMYLTLFMMVFHQKTKTWQCLNCGHPNPFIYQNGTLVSDKLLQNKGGMPIGFSPVPGEGYQEEDQVSFEATDDMHLLLYTDGIDEATHEETGELLGPERLEELLTGIVEQGDNFNLPETMINMVTGNKYDIAHDDCSVMAVSMLPNNVLCREAHLPGSFGDVTVLAQDLNSTLAGIGWPADAINATELVFVEYGNNIIDHNPEHEKGFHFHLRVYSQYCLLIFNDNGPAWLADKIVEEDDIDITASTFDARGRGLGIISTVTDFFKVYRNGTSNLGVMKINKFWRIEDER